uniref:EF-hand domain-containing protein n=1 Tax=Alexandrium monilatum TaxID=311494 RepID=A0A7S4R8W0_9DINO
MAKVSPDTLDPVEPVHVTKVIDVSKAPQGDIDHDPLLQKLKEWDKDGDGVFSSAEVMQAAGELLHVQEAKKHADTTNRRLGIAVVVLAVLLVLSMVGNLCGTVWALWMAKEEEVPQNTGVMLTSSARASGSASDAPKPVGTSALKAQAQGLSGLKEASKEELDQLEEISFFHDGGYHRMKVAQVHRYDGRVEVWGMPVGILVAEDTGEVHYAPLGFPSINFDACWGESAATTDATVCGEAVDNEPPNDLEVEDPLLQDADNAPVPSPNASMAALIEANGGRRLEAVGTDCENEECRRLVAVGTDGEGEEILREVREAETEASAVARRLSGRRRAAGSGSRRRVAGDSLSRRRSGASLTGTVATTRRRAFGSVTSSAATSTSTDLRRRAPVAATEGRRRVPTPPAPAASGSGQRRRGAVKVDGDSRRRQVDFYGTTDVRRRAVGSAVAAGAAGAAVGAGAGYLAGQSTSGSINAAPAPGIVDPNRRRRTPYYVENQYSSPSSMSTTCPAGKTRACDGGSCWCEEGAPAGATGGFFGLLVVICVCCPVMTFFCYLLFKSKD